MLFSFLYTVVLDADLKKAYDMNIIRRKILEKVATLTDHGSLHDDDEDENSSSDMVITTG